MGANTMKKRFIQVLITSAVVSTLFVSTVMASPEDDVASIKSQKAAAEEAADSVNEELVSLLVDYQALEQDISDQEDKIGEASKSLKKAQKEEEKQYEDMKLRIKYMYESGDTSFIETLFSAESFSDLLSKSEYVDKVYSYDREKLQDYVTAKEEVEDLKTQLESEEADMEYMADEMSAQQQNLESTLSMMRAQISDFDDQLAAAEEAAAAELAAAQAAAEEEAEEAVEEEPEEETEEIEEEPAEEKEEVKEETPSEEKKEEVSEQDTKKETKEENKEKKSSSSSSSSSSKKSSTSSSSSSSKKSSTSSSSSSSKKSSSSSSSSSSKKSSTSSSSSSKSSSSSSTSNASLGQQIADKACEYIGGKYVYGGTSLTTGVDCSGFVQQIHKLFGISTPRTSSAIRSGGKSVSYSDKMPGDVICYSGHVAIYIGNNTVVHASNSSPYPKGGIKTTSPANYRTVLAVRRYW